MVGANNTEFGTYFKQLRLKAGIATLHELTELLSSKGLIFEDSFLSHLQAGRKVPKKRKLFLSLLSIFKENYLEFTLEEGNKLLLYAGQGYLTETEKLWLGFTQKDALITTQDSTIRIPASWYQRMAQDYIIIFKNYIVDDPKFYKKLTDSYAILVDLLWNCIAYKYDQEVLGLWEIIKKYQWENGHWEEYEKLVTQIHALMIEKNRIQDGWRIKFNDIVEMYLWKKDFLFAYKLLKKSTSQLAEFDNAVKGIYFRQLGIIFFYYAQYTKSLSALTTSFRSFKKALAIREMCRTAIDIGILYEKLGDLTKSKEWYHEYHQVAQKHGWLELASSFEYHLSEIYTTLHDPKKAKEYYEASFQKEEQLKKLAGDGWRERFVKTRMQVCVDGYLK